MTPDDKYPEKQAQMETEKLKEKVDSLSPKDKQQIYEKGLELQTQQSQPQDASCLPALKVSDIEPTMPLTELEVALAAGQTPVQICAQPTNGLVYFRAFVSLHTLPEELRPYVPLFCRVLTNTSPPAGTMTGTPWSSCSWGVRWLGSGSASRRTHTSCKKK